MAGVDKRDSISPKDSIQPPPTTICARLDFKRMFHVVVGQLPVQEAASTNDNEIDGPDDHSRVDAEPRYEQERFSIHHDLFCRRSGFFNAARSECWCNNPSKPTEPLGDDPNIFAAYVQAVYTGIIEVDYYTEKDTDCYNMYQYADLWILADKLQAPTAANIVLDRMSTLFGKYYRVPGPGILR